MRRSEGGALLGRVDDEKALVVVAVGADPHPFDRLIGYVDDWVASRPDVVVVMQRGPTPPPVHGETFPLLPHDELRMLLGMADAVVVHAGPATVMEARAMGRLPIVVPRRRELGEHADDHQLGFARHLSTHGLARMAIDAEGLGQELAEALARPDRFRVRVESGAVPGVVGFGRVIDELLGIETELAEPPSSLVPPTGPVAR